uniref:Uncharacterized protein n=1 Tax=Lepeophtheirus salmonis TaxID=72036 RepID=A0A0K2V9P6_LEPSM
MYRQANNHTPPATRSRTCIKKLHAKVDKQGFESSQQGRQNFSFLTSRSMNVSDLEFAPAVQIIVGSVTTKPKVSRFRKIEGGNNM